MQNPLFLFCLSHIQVSYLLSKEITFLIIQKLFILEYSSIYYQNVLPIVNFPLEDNLFDSLQRQL